MPVGKKYAAIRPSRRKTCDPHFALERISAPPGVVIQAEACGSSVGRAELEFENLDRCYLADVYVPPQARGRGIGEALLQQAILIARDEGASIVRCHPIAFEFDENGQRITARTSTILAVVREQLEEADRRLKEWYSRLGFVLDPEDTADHWCMQLTYVAP